jgi:bifunctional non-homologous end joining protein LigD
MLASITDEPFNDDDWEFEIKWDGYRALAYLNEGQVQLRSRNNNPFEERYTAVYDALRTWPVNVVVDGEIVVLNEEGKSDFKALQDWNNFPNGELVYYIFDVLWLDGISLLSLPLTERKEVLKQIVPDSGVIRFSDSIDGFGKDFYTIAKQNGLEGIIAKQKSSIYNTGYRTKTWLKIKVEQRHEAIICGYTKKIHSDRDFSSLLLGRYEGGELIFIGQVGTGFNRSMQAEILKKMMPIVTKECPFEKTPTIPDPTVYVVPSLVCEVKYTELTPEGVMRHPSFQGLREDKNIADLNLDISIKKPQIKPSKSKQDKSTHGSFIDPAEEQAIVTVNDQPLKLTNLKKLYWIKEGITKGDMLGYYNRIMPYIFPYMKDRPQSLNRFPNGVEGESFYHKNMAGKVEPWVQTFRRFSESTTEDKDFMICSSEASLLYMANLGCIELNPWHSRVQTPHYPDWSVIDLDPGDISFEKVIETAIVVKKVLDSLQVVSFPKTSGSTGIHIYVPLDAKYNYEQSKQFAELVAHLVHEELPDFTSLIRNPQKRKDKIYIDYLQNRPIQTICAPYSIRPKPGATVSTPLDWSEVKKGLKMEDFTIKTIFERVQSEGDLFDGVLGPGMDLNKVLKKLAGLMPT